MGTTVVACRVAGAPGRPVAGELAMEGTVSFQGSWA